MTDLPTRIETEAPSRELDAERAPWPAVAYVSQYDCPCKDEQPDPCPMCGATVSGNDAVNGVCQIMAFVGRPIGDWITRAAPADLRARAEAVNG